MSGNLNLQLTLRLNDQVSAGVTKVMKTLQGGFNESQRSVNNLTKTMQGYAAGADTAAKRSESLVSALRRLANERGPVALINGMRAIADQATRAHRALESVARAARAASGVAAGAAAAGYVVSQPVNKTMDYGVRLAHMANTAFSERDTVGRIAGKRELNAAIVNSVRTGGGTRDAAAEALDNLISSGAVSGKDAMSMLPTLMRSGTAANADPNQLGNIAIRGIQTFKIAPEQMGRVIDMGITGGQEGGFELKDMSKWLPQQMAYARNSGMSGLSGMAKLIAANQAVAITAGTKDEAGNNLLNLLAKINSQDTANDAKKLGINLSGSLAASRAKGMDSLDGFVSIVDQVVGKDKKYQALQDKLKTAKGGERKEILESQADILQGSAIGKIIQDRQAMLALVGIMGNRDYMTNVQNKVLNGAGAADKNFSVISAEPGFKVDQAKNESVFATQTAFERLTPVIGEVADGMTANAREYPMLAAASAAATTALTALAAAAGASGLVSLLTGGAGKAATGAGKAAGMGILEMLGITAAFAGGMPVAELAGMGAAGIGTVAGGVALAGAGGYAVGSLANWGINMADEHLGTSIGETIGRSVAQVLAAFGNKEAQQAIKVEIDVKNGNIVAAVNAENGRQAKRN